MSHPRFSPRPRTGLALALTCVGLALAVPAGAAGSFDGTYKGTQATTSTANNASCASLDRGTSLVVTDNHFTRHWGQADLQVPVAADGSFDTKVTTSDSRKLRTIGIKGKITGGALEADIGSDVCSAHLSLKKS
jgi:hypothetical protein